jgi:ABC-type glycerol-3-phosphate transport system substrate-binding protein
MISARVSVLSLSLLLVMALLAGCSIPGAPSLAAPKAEPELLFVHALGCPHCAAQRPIIEKFSELYPEVKVTWVEYSKITPEQQRLIEGTQGHPVMVFHQGGDVRQILGETAINMMEREFAIFKREQVATPGDSLVLGHSGATCH